MEIYLVSLALSVPKFPFEVLFANWEWPYLVILIKTNFQACYEFVFIQFSMWFIT